MNKLLILIALLALTSQSFALGTCAVNICHYLGDDHYFQEVCFDGTVPEDQAILGNEVAPESPYYEPHFDIFEADYTQINEIYQCGEIWI